MPKTTKPKPQYADSAIHNSPRRRTVPRDIRDKAALWLEVFNSTLDAMLVSNDGEPKQVKGLATEYADAAGSVADAALDVIENRWPGVPLD